MYAMEDIIQTKQDLKYKNTSYIWNQYHFNSTKRVGHCSQTAQAYIHEKQKYSLEDFEQYYYEHAKSKEELRKNAIEFNTKLKEAGIKSTVELAEKYQWIRVIYDTYKGSIEKEQIALETMKKIASKNAKLRHTNDIEDRKYSLDIIMTIGNRHAGYQIKPISFWNGINKEDIQNDLKTCIKGQEEWLKANQNQMVIWYFYEEKEGLKYYAKTIDEMKERIIA